MSSGPHSLSRTSALSRQLREATSQTGSQDVEGQSMTVNVPTLPARYGSQALLDNQTVDHIQSPVDMMTLRGNLAGHSLPLATPLAASPFSTGHWMRGSLGSRQVWASQTSVCRLNCTCACISCQICTPFPMHGSICTCHMHAWCPHLPFLFLAAARLTLPLPPPMHTVPADSAPALRLCRLLHAPWPQRAR